MTKLRDEHPFESRLWLDQPDALAKIERLASSRRISADEARLLRTFHEEGFVRLTFDAPEPALDELVADIDRLWKEKPPDLLYAALTPHLRPMRLADEATERQPPYRIHEVQSHSRAARRLYLHPQLHRIARLILGQAPVAIQSILFEYGSAQALHRDPVFVPIAEAGHLVAAWIALEDIDPASGALMYVPRSHRLPPYEFRPGVTIYDPKSMGEADLQAEAAWRIQQMEASNLRAELFTPRKGEVLFWHAGLYHGGGSIDDRSKTRKSYVVHYSSRRHHRVTAVTIVEPAPDGQPTVRIAGTHRLMQQGEAVGFASPIARGEFQWWPTLVNRVTGLFR